MKLKEFIDKDLLVDEDKKVFDKGCNEYKDKDGKANFLDVRNSVVVDLIKCQIEDGEGLTLIENVEEYK